MERSIRWVQSWKSKGCPVPRGVSKLGNLSRPHKHQVNLHHPIITDRLPVMTSSLSPVLSFRPSKHVTAKQHVYPSSQSYGRTPTRDPTQVRFRQQLQYLQHPIAHIYPIPSRMPPPAQLLCRPLVDLGPRHHRLPHLPPLHRPPFPDRRLPRRISHRLAPNPGKHLAERDLCEFWIRGRKGVGCFGGGATR